MSEETLSALVLTLESSLTGAGHELLGDPGALGVAEALLASARATVALHDGGIQVDTYNAAGDRLISYELEREGGHGRQGRFADHRARTVHPLHVPGRRVAPASWMLPHTEKHEVRVYLENGLLLRADTPLEIAVSATEARLFWGDLFWLQPDHEAAVYWEQLSAFGLPRHVTLSDASGAALVEIAVVEAAHRPPDAFDAEDYRRVGPAPLRGSASGTWPAHDAGTHALGAGAGEHIGWIVAPSLVSELQKLVNTIGAACGEFDKRTSQGGLVLDWYDRAAKKLGANTLNAFTRVREVLKSAIALHILPSAVNEGTVPPEMAGEYEQWLKSLFADKKVAASQRWCTFLNGLQAPPPEFGGKAPTAGDHKKHRHAVLLQLVDQALQKRYGRPVIDRPKPYHWSCWAFDFDARNFKMKLRPGAQVVKTFTVTPTGLRLDVSLERVSVDFEYETQPSGSAGNVALCIFSFGAANIVEIQFGDATVTAKDVVLSLEITPKQVGNAITLAAKLGTSSHADLDYLFRGSNIFTLGLTEVLSAIFSLADVFESDLLDVVGQAVEGFADDLDLRFPNLFNFDDAPASVLDKAVLASNPGKAQLIGARVKLPADRAPAPLPPLAIPTCSGDFALTIATDYLNGVLAHRLSRFQKAAKKLSFDWKKYVSEGGLPGVSLPGGYEPQGEGGKFPADYEETDEAWTVGAPVFKPAALATLPGLDDALGTIHIPITYRLTRTHYAWGGTVRAPEVAPEWWWLGFKGPIPVDGLRWDGLPPIDLDKAVIDLDHVMTARYGQYRQADGEIVSPPVPGLSLEAVPHVNPSPAWHAVDVGGVIVEWFPYAVATDEHINVQLEATMPAHLNLTTPLAFLPEMDLSYGALQVAVKKLSASAAFPGLQGQGALFAKRVQTYLQPFAALHPFQKTFHHGYLNAWPLCADVFVPYAPKQTPVMLTFMVDSMRHANDAQKLHVERDGARLKVTFRFLDRLAG